MVVMASPVRPEQVRALIISESDDWCTVFKKLTRSFYLTYLLIRYLFDEDGHVTTDSTNAQWGVDICQYIDCTPEPEATETTTP